MRCVGTSYPDTPQGECGMSHSGAGIVGGEGKDRSDTRDEKNARDKEASPRLIGVISLGREVVLNGT